MPLDEKAQAAAIIAELNQHVEQTVKSITLNVTDQLEKTTPVETGKAAANWRPTTGEPDGEFISDVRTAREAQAAGKGDVVGYKLTDGKTVVENNAPYIELLNKGSSDREPAGFVERAIDVALLLERLK